MSKCDNVLLFVLVARLVWFLFCFEVEQMAVDGCDDVAGSADFTVVVEKPPTTSTLHTRDDHNLIDEEEDTTDLSPLLGDHTLLRTLSEESDLILA